MCSVSARLWCAENYALGRVQQKVALTNLFRTLDSSQYPLLGKAALSSQSTQIAMKLHCMIQILFPSLEFCGSWGDISSYRAIFPAVHLFQCFWDQQRKGLTRCHICLVASSHSAGRFINKTDLSAQYQWQYLWFFFKKSMQRNLFCFRFLTSRRGKSIETRQRLKKYFGVFRGSLKTIASHMISA